MQSVRRKQAASLHQRLRDRLTPYAAAASVSLAAAVPSAHGAVVYKPANTVITNGFSLTIEGVDAITFKLNGNFGSAFLSASTPNGAVVPSGAYAACLNSGALIDRFETLNAGVTRIDRAIILSDSSTAEGYGPWGGIFGSEKTGYIGFEYSLKGQKHFGWARLVVTQNWNVDSPLKITATLTGYAYETAAYRGIKAGTETGAVEGELAPQASNRATLGLLAFGADALPLWRREQAR